MEINSFEVVHEPESIPPDNEEADELLISRMMSATKNSSKVRNALPKMASYNESHTKQEENGIQKTKMYRVTIQVVPNLLLT